MFGIPCLKPLLDVLLVIFINYLYCSTTHEFRNLVQTYKVTYLEVHYFWILGQLWEQLDIK